MCCNEAVRSLLVVMVMTASVEAAPGPAKIELGVRKPRYLLGENVLVDFCVVNTGKAPITIGVGGDYRGSSRSLRFKVELRDAKGALLPDPDPDPYNLGGRGYSPAIEPGKKWCQSLPLQRYARVSAAGTYTITATHDLEWPAGTAPTGTAKITFAMPTAVDAERVLAAMEKLPTDPSTTAGQVAIEYADWSAPVYEPYVAPLAARAAKGSKEALTALTFTATPSATKVLVGLLGDRTLGREVARALAPRLPDPALSGQLGPRNVFHDQRIEQRKHLAQTWHPQYADAVRTAARAFLAKSEIEDHQIGAFMLEAVGLPSDAPELIAALTEGVARANRTPPEADVYPPPRGAMMELLRATRMMVPRGLVPKAKPASTGELVVWLIAIEAGARPAGWEADLGKALQHEMPYVRELALRSTPAAVPPSLIPLLVKNLAHANVDVQVAAAELARAAELRQLALEVVKAMDRAVGLRLNVISYAAYHLGARLDRIDMLIKRLSDPAAFDEALSELCDVLSYTGRSTDGVPSAAQRAAVIPHWKKLVITHRADLEAGTKIALSKVTPALLPPQWSLGMPTGGRWPPKP
jgi:hypothetical protein